MTLDSRLARTGIRLAAAALFATVALSMVGNTDAAGADSFAAPRGTAQAKATPKPTPEITGGRTLSDYNIQKE